MFIFLLKYNRVQAKISEHKRNILFFPLMLQVILPLVLHIKTCCNRKKQHQEIQINNLSIFLIDAFDVYDVLPFLQFEVYHLVFAG